MFDGQVQKLMMLIDLDFQGAFSVVERAPIAKALTAISCQPRVSRDELAAILRKKPACQKYQQRQIVLDFVGKMRLRDRSRVFKPKSKSCDVTYDIYGALLAKDPVRKRKRRTLFSIFDMSRELVCHTSRFMPKCKNKANAMRSFQILACIFQHCRKVTCSRSLKTKPTSNPNPITQCSTMLQLLNGI